MQNQRFVIENAEVVYYSKKEESHFMFILLYFSFFFFFRLGCWQYGRTSQPILCFGACSESSTGT